MIFVFLVQWSCEAFPSVDDLSRSVSRKPSDKFSTNNICSLINFYSYHVRSVLINLAKTLSSSLQKAMTANNQKIENILDDQQEVMAGIYSLVF